MLKENNKSFDGKKFIDSDTDNACTLMDLKSAAYCYYPLQERYKKKKSF